MAVWLLCGIVILCSYGVASPLGFDDLYVRDASPPVQVSETPADHAVADDSFAVTVGSPRQIAVLYVVLEELEGIMRRDRGFSPANPDSIKALQQQFAALIEDHRAQLGDELATHLIESFVTAGHDGGLLLVSTVRARDEVLFGVGSALAPVVEIPEVLERPQRDDSPWNEIAVDGESPLDRARQQLAAQLNVPVTRIVPGPELAHALRRELVRRVGENDSRGVHALSDAVTEFTAAGVTVAEQQPRAPAPTGDIEQVFRELSDGILTSAHCRLIVDNVEAWLVRWYMIQNARESIDLTYYIIVDDVFGRSLMGLLHQKAQAGVRVRLKLDARGTKGYTRTLLGKDYMQELAETDNVEIRVFNPLHRAVFRLPKGISQPVAGIHDKIIVVDNEWVLTGGRNISSNYFGHPDDVPGVYRDTDVLLRGREVAAQATAAFEAEFHGRYTMALTKNLFGNWAEKATMLDLTRRAMHRHISGDDSLQPSDAPLRQRLGFSRMLRQLEPHENMRGYDSYRPLKHAEPYPVRIVNKTTRLTGLNEITDSVVALIDASQEEILIQNPYVILTDEAKGALRRASERGVPITIVTNSPESTDSILTQAMFVREWKGLLAALPTARIFVFQGDAKLHGKVFVFDRKVTGIGTYNLDPLAQNVLSEVMALVKSSAFAEENRSRIYEDIEDCVEYLIRITDDGTIEQVVGPSDHCNRLVVRLIELLGASIRFMRPLI